MAKGKVRSPHHLGSLTASAFKGNADGATKADNKRIAKAAKKVNRVSLGNEKAEKPSRRKA